MPNSNIGYKLDNVSVVILAQEHNPAIVNPDFLKTKGIVKNNWDIDNNAPTFSTPTLSLICFKNGVQWQVSPEKCTIAEKVESVEFKGSYLVQECAKKYVKTLKYIPYTALGINWNLSLDVKEEDLQNWIKTRFLKSGKWQNDITLTNFTFKVPPQCNLTLNAQNKMINCNFHTDISSTGEKVKVINSALNKFRSNQENLKNTLNKYFKEDLL